MTKPTKHANNGVVDPQIKRQKIAVIGSGAAGACAAYYLNKQHDVHVFEAEDRPGGHTCTVEVQEQDKCVPIDMGFIVFNERNYPNFNALIQELDVDYKQSDMSFGYHNPRTGYHWSSIFPDGLTAHKKSLFSPSHWRLFWEIHRFNVQAKQDLPYLSESITLDRYAKEHKFSDNLLNRYLIPMGAAIWSASIAEIKTFPAKAFLQFWNNHMLLNLVGKPKWRTITGGSQSYLSTILTSLHNPIRLNTPIKKIVHQHNHVSLIYHQESEAFDAVFICTHADQAYKLLEHPTPTQTRLLSPWHYSSNTVTLHQDKSLLPPKKSAWASWNFRDIEDVTRASCITYYMNRLQSLDSDQDYFVSLNEQDIDPSKVISSKTFTHPIYSRESMATQSELAKLNQEGRCFFAGSYFGWGFHEDAMMSALDAIDAFQHDAQ